MAHLRVVKGSDERGTFFQEGSVWSIVYRIGEKRVVTNKPPMAPPISPMAPPMSGGRCLAVVRIEDGTLSELADLLIEQCKNRWLPNGTAVILAAGGQMAREGTAAYAANLVAAVNKLKRYLPAGSFVAHGPLAFACGNGDMATIRTAIEISHWQVALDREGAVGDLLPMANMATIRMLERRAIDMTQTPPMQKLSLPANMAGTLTRVWSVGDGSPLPAATEPLTEEDEAELLFLLCTELNRKLAIGLDSKYSTVRMVASGIAKNSRLIIVGGRHATGLAMAAAAGGHQYVTLPLESNPTAGQVSHCAKLLRDQVEDIPPGNRAGVLVIFAILDSIIYMAKSKEGGVNPLKATESGIQHVEGDLVLATGDMLEERLANLVTLLNSICGASAVMLCPLPRYLSGRCCTKPSHMPSYATNHRQRTLEQLDVARRSIKDMLYKLRVRGVAVANYARTAMECGWKDSITPNEAGYAAILERTLTEGMNNQLASQRERDKRPPTAGPSNKAKISRGSSN